MRDHLFNSALTRLSALFLLAFMLAACSEGTPSPPPASTGGGPNTPPPALPPALIALGTSTNFILNDNATAATLTASLVDSSNAVMSGVYVSFSTTTGSLTAGSATTDAKGQATVQLTSGLFDLTNRTATVTATVGTQSASIPILIKGSTLALNLASSNTIQVGAGTITASATATDAGGLGRPNQTIRFSIGAASTGAGTLSAATLVTDATGVASPLVFTPTVAGTVVLTAEWLNSAGAVTVTATQNITVTAAAGIAFAITLPVANPQALSTGANQNLAATVPGTIGGVAVARVRITSTAGTWTGTNPAAGPANSILQTPVANAVAATYTAPNYSGSVTVQVDALDASDVILSSLTRTFTISATAASANRIYLTASVSTIVPSSGANISTLTLVAVVRDINNNAVGGAPVLFGLLGTTGSGESIAPAVVYTDSFGYASTTFSAGAAPTLGAIYAQARVTGSTCAGTMPDPRINETTLLCDSTPLMVSSLAVSVTVGFGSKIESVEKDTQYRLPGSVLVVNSNGSPVAGVPVTLSVFPIEYRNGIIFSGKVWSGVSTWLWECIGPFNTTVAPTWDPINNVWLYTTQTQFTVSEDVNRNGILDAGEDTGINIFGAPIAQTPAQAAAQAISGNGLLSPPAAAGGSVPMSVITDSNGAATFYLQYPKSSARFIKDEVQAKVIVMGTESNAKMNLALPMSMEDNLFPTCPLGREASY